MKIQIYTVKTSFHAVLGEHKFFEHFSSQTASRNTLWMKRISKLSADSRRSEKMIEGVFSVSLETQFSTLQIDEKSFWTISALKVLKSPEGSKFLLAARAGVKSQISHKISKTAIFTPSSTPKQPIWRGVKNFALAKPHALSKKNPFLPAL